MAEDIILDEADVIDTSEVIENLEGDDTAKLFAKFWVDPDNATTDDLLKIIQRAEKAEKLIIEKKKAEKSSPKQDAQSTDSLEELKLRLFFIENEDAKPFKDEFLKVKEQYPQLSFDDALELAKSRKPKESKTVKEWFQWGWYKPKPKTIEQMSDEEALELPPEQYAQYLKKTGKIM